MAMPKNPQRSAALAAGETTYFTGKPCKHGHVAPRNTSDSSCTACRAGFRESYREQARIHAREKRREMLAADPEGTRAKWSAANRRLRKEKPDIYRALDRKHGRLKRQRNPGAKLAETRKRQAAKIKRTPAWADLKAIQAIYENCPPGYHVDHVIPLRGEKVSGLHVPGNLQYLSAHDNISKGATYHV